jgi:hypothetical protein
MNLGEKTSSVLDNLLRSKYVERDHHAAGEGIRVVHESCIGDRSEQPLTDSNSPPGCAYLPSKEDDD